MNKKTLETHYKKIGIEIGQGRDHEEIVYGIGLIYTVMYQQIAVYLKKYEITPEEMNVLMLVKHQGQQRGLSQVEIGRRLMVTAHNMTRLLQGLEKERLVERFSDQRDARITLVEVTSKGSQLLDKVWLGYEKKVQDLAGRLSVKEQKGFSELIQKWLSKG